MTLPGALIALAAILLIGGPLVGLWFFTSDRSRSVKFAESETEAVVERITQAAVVYQREIVKRYRLDRHDFYVWPMAGFWMYGAGIILAPAPNSNLTALAFATQQSLGLCLIVGATLALGGVVCGAPIGFGRRIAGRVSRNITSPVLGDDVRLPYTLACAGLLSIGISMGFYGYTLYTLAPDKLLGTLGGGLSWCFAGACITTSRRFIQRIRDYTRQRGRLLDEAATRMDREP